MLALDQSTTDFLHVSFWYFTNQRRSFHLVYIVSNVDLLLIKGWHSTNQRLIFNYSASDILLSITFWCWPFTNQRLAFNQSILSTKNFNISNQRLIFSSRFVPLRMPTLILFVANAKQSKIAESAFLVFKSSLHLQWRQTIIISSPIVLKFI